MTVAVEEETGRVLYRHVNHLPDAYQVFMYGDGEKTRSALVALSRRLGSRDLGRGLNFRP